MGKMFERRLLRESERGDESVRDVMSECRRYVCGCVKRSAEP
jgi:hypothetical protein